MRILAAFLLVLILAGCVLLPSAGDRYTGEPTDLVVQIQRSASASPQGMSLMAKTAQSAEMHQVVVRIEKGNIYRVFRTVDIPADQDQAVIEVKIPSGTGYKVSAFSHDGTGSVLEEGRELAVAAAAGVENVVVLELGPIEYEAVIPDELYSGGKVNQFRLRVPEDSVLRNNMILLGLQPWADFDEWHHLPSSERWLSSSSQRFPEVTEPTPVYYQIHLCVPAPELPAELGNVCYNEPPIGEALPYVELLPEPLTGPPNPEEPDPTE